ncbi:MAG TPA: hypothetical protein VF974_05455 [Patescibacteria group bacterium]
MNAEPDREITQVPESAETILRSTSDDYKRLKAEAAEALDRQDVESYKQKLIEAAQLVAGLDTKINQDMVDGSRLSQDDRSEIVYFSMSAKEWVDEKNFFGMSTIFVRKGSTIGEPNDLEKLIERVYPAPKPAEKP